MQSLGFRARVTQGGGPSVQDLGNGFPAKRLEQAHGCVEVSGMEALRTRGIPGRRDSAGP